MDKIYTDGIIFDMDGTIWDNTPAFAKSWTRAIRDHGYDMSVSADDLKKLFGKTMTDIADSCIPDEIPENRYATVKDCEIYEMEDLLASRQDTTYPGLVETLESLSKRVKLFIVSNCQAGYIESYIDMHGHGKYFTDFICYGDNGLGKADNIKHIVEKHGLNHAVYVGDIQGDKDACDKAGVDFIWASYGYGESVDSYVAKLSDIKDLDQVIQ